MFLEVKNLNKTFESTKALDGVSFSVEKGTINCILGPSGCGKTTILRCLGGFESPDSGEINLESRSILSLPAESRPTATVFQSYGLFPHKSVMANVSYGLKFRKISKKDGLDLARETLDLVGLKGYENRRIHQLSGGEQQRVALARSLVLKPDLLLLDEPFSNLDAKLRVQMREEIQRIQKEFNITTIFVTHDQEDAFTVADQIILMNKGRVEQVASPYDLYNEPSGEFALDFIGRSNIFRLDDGLGFVRPETIKIYKDPGPGREKARLVGVSFKGQTLEYSLELLDRKVLAVDLSRGQAFEEGEEVYIGYEIKKI